MTINYEKAKKNLLMKKDLEKVKELLIESSKAYYNSSSLILSDDEYDELYKAYKSLTNDEIIGAEPNKGSKTVSVEHSYNNLVGTLDKAKDLDEVKPFLKRFSTVDMKNKKYTVRMSLKFDGNSITIEYDKNGVPKKALTRGQDGKGKDIINVFSGKDDIVNMNNFNLSLLDSEFAIKYEVIITYEDYEKLCKETGEEYANPRSTISGILNSNEGVNFRKYMTLVPLEMRVKDEGFAYENGLKKLYRDEISEIYPINYYDTYFTKVKKGTLEEIEEEIKKYYDKTNKMRETLPFMIDGIVVEFLNKEIIDKYFYDPRGYIPQYSFAVKLPYLEKPTEVTDIDYCIGNSGRITPRIWFKEVQFNGTTHTKQQISNYKRFRELNLGKGSKIMVSYHNDCLSYITKMEEQPEGIEPFKFINRCPICNTKIKVRKNDNGELTLAKCPNKECPGRLKGKIENYFIKMDIKGIKMNTIEDLYDNKLLTDIPSIYKMNYKKVAKLLGNKTAENIKNAIEEKEFYDYEILGSLGINNISIENAKVICKNYNLDEIIDLYNDDKLYDSIIKLEGFSNTKTNNFIEGFEENSDTIEFLYSKGYKNYKDNFKDAKFDLNIVVTGWRPDPVMEMKMESMGIKIKSSVSKKVNLVVYSDNPGATKVNKAKELNIPTMYVEEFKEKYNI
jgi:DNA ligase (NAD+)